MILASPAFGAVFAGLIIAMALLIIGIQMVADEDPEEENP